MQNLQLLGVLTAVHKISFSFQGHTILGLWLIFAGSLHLDKYGTPYFSILEMEELPQQWKESIIVSKTV
jgi:hypothetical protein